MMTQTCTERHGLTHAAFLKRLAGAHSATSADRLGCSDAIAVQLRIGRVNRKLNRFVEGDVAYALAGVLAEAAGNVRSSFLSRVGRAISIQARGNLAEAERLFRELAADARAADERDIEARAHH